MAKAEGGDLLVIASQTCDIVKPPAKEPFIDSLRALTMKTPPPKNSYRFFLLDPKRILVADAAYRVQLRKEVLLGLKPEPGLAADPRRQAWFGIWLANRYTREAFEDEIVDAVVRPIRTAITALVKSKDPDIRRALASVEIRLVDLAPASFYSVNLVMLSEDPIEGELRLAAGRVVQAISDSLRPGLAALESCPILAHDEISLREYLSTREIDLDDISYGGALLS